MENEFDIFKDFVDNTVTVQQIDDTYITGKLVSIDGYFNVIMFDCAIEGEHEKYEKMFIRGTQIEQIFIK